MNDKNMETVENEETEQSGGNSIFYIELVMRKILSNLSPKDLLNTRIVNTLWYELSSDKLRDSRASVSFKSCQQVEEYITTMEERWIQDYIPFIVYSFDLSHIEISSVQHFGTKFGHYVKTYFLQTGNWSNRPPGELCQELPMTDSREDGLKITQLLAHSPFIRKLTLRSRYQIFMPVEYEAELPKNLDNLQILSIYYLTELSPWISNSDTEDYKPIICFLLRHSPNLKVFNIRCRDGLILCQQTLSVIHSKNIKLYLHAEVRTPDHFIGLQKLAEWNGRIVKLRLQLSDPGVGGQALLVNTLLTLLTNQAGNLVELDMILYVVLTLELPRLSKLKVLNIEIKNDSRYAMYCITKFQPNQFPHLQKVSLTPYDDYDTDCFGSGPFESVEILRFKFGPGGFNLRRDWAGTFPNLKSLYIEGPTPGGFNMGFNRAIDYTLAHLITIEDLQIKFFRSNLENTPSHFPDIPARTFLWHFLTGFTTLVQDTQLLGPNEIPVQAERINLIGPTPLPSLANMKKLKRLTVENCTLEVLHALLYMTRVQKLRPIVLIVSLSRKSIQNIPDRVWKMFKDYHLEFESSLY